MNEDMRSKAAPRIIVQDRNRSPPRRATKSAPTTPKKPLRGTRIPIENVPDLKTSLERLRAKQMAATKPMASSSSSGRSGHQFTVGNISNGLIYLRPVLRPAHELHKVLHPTPPNSADERRRDSWDDEDREEEEYRENKRNQTSPPRTPPQRSMQNREQNNFYLNSSPPVPTRPRHHRAHSFSTVTGRSTPSEPDHGGYRVVIDRADTVRPKTAGPQPSFNGLDVTIPHYTIGSPRFTPHGTPFLHGSSSLNLPSTMGEVGSRTNSQVTDFKWLFPFDLKHTSPQTGNQQAENLPDTPFASPPPSMPSPIQLSVSPPVVGPHIYDALSCPLTSDHPSVVRFDLRSQNIIAATPPRIIAQITSATFLDYQLLSDFFLTFRLFMTPSDLVAYLIARLRWAIDKNDDVGRVVRVRTFVAIRHWLLNYFADDFLPSFSLRKKFVNAMNDLSRVVMSRGAQSDVKIIRELKKCWRRTCALYWEDHSGQNVDASVEKDILPGGPPGQRTSPEKPPPSYIQRPSMFAPNQGSQVRSKYAVEGSGRFGDFISRPAGAVLKDGKGRPLAKAASDASIHATSQGHIKAEKRPSPASFTFPSSSSSSKPTASQAAAEAATVPKRARPSGHKRSGSFSDALRDYREPLPLQNSIARSTHLLMAFPYAGSLVRGNLMPPTAAFVELIAPPTPVDELMGYELNIPHSGSTSTILQNNYYLGHNNNPHRAGLGGPGMKKFLGSVRRALSGKAPSSIYTHAGIHSPIPIHRNGSTDSGSGPEGLVRYVAANYIRNSGSSSSRTGTRHSDSKNTRVDLLGAGVVDAFQKVLQERRWSEHEKQAECDKDISVDARKKAANNRKTIDTSVLSEHDEKSSVGNFPLSPITRRRGNTLLRQRDLNLLKEEKIIPSLNVDGQQSSTEGIDTEDYGYIGIPRQLHLDTETISDSTSLLETPKAAKQPITLDHNLFTQQSPSNTFLSDLSFSRFRRHSDISHCSAFDGASENSSSFGPTPRQNDDLIQGGGNRLLRRRPGGDLRAAITVTDLEVNPRPRSAGSIEGYSVTESFISSIAPRGSALTFGTPANRFENRPQQLAAGVISLGAVAKGGGMTIDAVVETSLHGPETAKEAFEAGVMKLAALPDTESDDGGVEIALMKLEGRYDRRNSVQTPVVNSQNGFELSSIGGPSQSLEHLSLGVDAMRESTVDSQDSVIFVKNQRETSAIGNGEHGEIDQSKRTRRRQKQVLDHAPLDTPPAFDSSHNSSFRIGHTKAQSFDHKATEKQKRLRKQSKHRTTKEDGLRDDISELSSDVSFEMVSRSQSLANVSVKFPQQTVIAELGLPSHPLRHPPSPPMTLEQALTISPRGAQRPTTPQQGFPFPPARFSSPGSTLRQRKPARESVSLLHPPSLHLPFILAYDSELLTKQFTLIEKDALNEIDWKELVELRWKQTSTTVRDWVEFLRSKNVRGVEVVIARFNLMWKWAMSEVVMTRQLDERARTVVKLIHIAAHARRIQNYATMYQITAALLTSNIARLRKTWSMVSPADMVTFREMEALIQPVRNFHNLRVEMDKVTGESGCIPFVGLFTHDLIYNAQRPSHITGTPDGDLLVNFEKHRMTAAIIKRLLRLIEASHKYDFKAVDGVCERCLWIAALSDDEIRGLSKNLE